MNKKVHDKIWFPYTVALCIAVVLFVFLTHLSSVMNALGIFIGYFNPLFLGCILAYLMNPLAKLFKRTAFKRLHNEKLGWGLSIALTIAVFLFAVQFLLGTLVPQLIDSITTLMENMDGYLAALNSLIERLGISDVLSLDEAVMPSGDILTSVITFLKENTTKILNISTAAGRTLIDWLISAVLSIYLLAGKEGLKRGTARLMHALVSEKRYEKVVAFFTRCDTILSRYIVFSLLDALIIGIANAIFMTCLGMQYVGLVSLIVGVTNLIPTFGPVIGYVLGGFILLLVNPIHAVIFVVFSFILQLLDGYVIKPKLFGNSLGVSGLLILTAVIVCGNMFGILGMLLAIPLAAIVDFVCRDEILPALERRKAASECAEKNLE